MWTEEGKMVMVVGWLHDKGCPEEYPLHPFLTPSLSPFLSVHPV